MTWEVKVLQLQSPDGDSIEIKSETLILLLSMAIQTKIAIKYYG